MDQLEKVEKLNFDLTAEDFAEIAMELTPTIQSYMAANLARSGVKRETGRLEEAVGGANVWFARPKSKGLTLYIGFAAGRPDNKTAKDRRQRSVYLYGSAVNSGAVHQPLTIHADKAYGALGKRAKVSLKRKVFGLFNSAKRAKGVSKFKATHIGRRFQVSPGSIVIHRAFNFFKLNASQEASVIAMTMNLISQKLMDKMAKGSK